MQPASEKKAKTHAEMFREMIPFALYAAVPIIVTIAVAFIFGEAQ